MQIILMIHRQTDQPIYLSIYRHVNLARVTTSAFNPFYVDGWYHQFWPKTNGWRLSLYNWRRHMSRTQPQQGAALTCLLNLMVHIFNLDSLIFLLPESYSVWITRVVCLHAWKPCLQLKPKPSKKRKARQQSSHIPTDQLEFPRLPDVRYSRLEITRD